MGTVTPAQLKSCMEESKTDVHGIRRDTGIHFNTVYRFLRGQRVLSSTRTVLTYWVRDKRESFKASNRKTA